MTLLFHLILLFVACVVVSILGAILLFFVHNQKMQNAIFVVLGGWAFVISYVNAISIPMVYVGQQMLAWIFGFLAAVALLIRYAGKTHKRYLVSNVLVTISLVSSALGMFLFMQ